MLSHLIGPISTIKVNGHVSRLTVLMTAMLMIVFLQVVASRAVIAFFPLLALADSVLYFCEGRVIYHYLVFPFFRSAEGS